MLAQAAGVLASVALSILYVATRARARPSAGTSTVCTSKPGLVGHWSLGN